MAIPISPPKAGIIFEGEKRFDLVVRYSDNYRQNIDDLRNLFVDLPNDGSQIPLKELADINYKPGPMQISRDNTYRRVSVGVNVRGRDVETMVEEVQQKLEAQLDLPEGYFIEYGGSFENLKRAKDRLTIVVPIALLLIFILLYFALNSATQAAMIYIAVPLAAIGGIYSLFIRVTNVNMNNYLYIIPHKAFYLTLFDSSSISLACFSVVSVVLAPLMSLASSSIRSSLDSFLTRVITPLSPESLLMAK